VVDKLNLLEKFTLFEEQWTPKIVGELNGDHLKIAKIEGEFHFHQHDNTDELFLVVKGELLMHFEDKTVTVGEGEIIVVPKGVPHKPEAPSECYILMIERAGTLNTGDVENERTITEPERL
jgi:mannose-6-phosphate isomerase-like protein (cupin superfamily)